MSQTRYSLLNTFHIFICISQERLGCDVVTSNPEISLAWHNSNLFLTRATCLTLVAGVLSLVAQQHQCKCHLDTRFHK